LSSRYTQAALRGSEIGQKNEGEEGFLFLGMGRTIECFQKEGKVL